MNAGGKRGYPKAILGLLLLVVLGLATAVTVRADDDGDGGRAALLAKADKIAAKVSSLRGLKIKRKIDRGVMTKPEIRKRIVERMDQEYSAAELTSEELVMKRLGLLPLAADYRKMVIDLLTDEIAGFYDPWERRLYIAGWQPSSGAGFDDGIMAHEIDHALQDQHFNLRTFMKKVKDNADASAARQALVEGDGMALMVEFMMPGGASPWSDPRILQMMTGNVASGGSKSLAAAPLILREGLVFPYTYGLSFVAYFRKHHSWKRIDQIYRKPPLATEHILHPTKYETYERPDEITAKLPAALGDGMVSMYDDVSGELGMAIFLRQHGIAHGKAEIAAEGWGGDRLVLYGRKDQGNELAGTVAVHYTVWDHAADAMEWFDAAGDALPQLADGGKETARTAAKVVYDDGGEIYWLERRDDAVVLIAGVGADKAEALADQVWKTWKVRRR